MVQILRLSQYVKPQSLYNPRSSVCNLEYATSQSLIKRITESHPTTPRRISHRLLLFSRRWSRRGAIGDSPHLEAYHSLSPTKCDERTTTSRLHQVVPQPNPRAATRYPRPESLASITRARTQAEARAARTKSLSRGNGWTVHKCNGG